jgi:hypothetical protein
MAFILLPNGTPINAATITRVQAWPERDYGSGRLAPNVTVTLRHTPDKTDQTICECATWEEACALRDRITERLNEIAPVYPV